MGGGGGGGGRLDILVMISEHTVELFLCVCVFTKKYNPTTIRPDFEKVFLVSWQIKSHGTSSPAFHERSKTTLSATSWVLITVEDITTLLMV